MMFSQRRARQSHQPTVINTGSSLARNLAFFVSPIGGVMYEHCQGRVPTEDRAPTTRGAQTISSCSLLTNINASTSAQYQKFPDLSAYNILGDMTLIWGGVIDSDTSVLRCFCAKSAGGFTNTPFDFRTDNSGPPLVPALLRGDGSGVQLWAGPTLTISLGVYHQIAVTIPVASATATFYLDATSTFQSTAGTVTPTAGATTLNIGQREDGAVNMDGAVEFVAGWTRVLDATEILAMYINPWQVLRSAQSKFVRTPPGSVLQYLDPLMFGGGV